MGSGEGGLGASAKIERGRPPLFIEGLRWRGDGKVEEIGTGSDRRRREMEGGRRKEGEGDGISIGRWGRLVRERERDRAGSGGRSEGIRIRRSRSGPETIPNGPRSVS